MTIAPRFICAVMLVNVAAAGCSSPALVADNSNDDPTSSAAGGDRAGTGAESSEVDASRPDNHDEQGTSATEDEGVDAGAESSEVDASRSNDDPTSSAAAVSNANRPESPNTGEPTNESSKARAKSADTDSDGINNFDDNCPATANRAQRNSDGDDWGDACDRCPRQEVPSGQTPGDGCPYGASPIGAPDAG